MTKRLAPLLGLLAAALCGCYAFNAGRGGAQADFSGPRKVEPADVAVAPGYEIEAVAQGLTFPTAVTFDNDGRVYVVEAGYAAGDSWAAPRLLRLEPDGRFTIVAQGGTNGPWTGAVYAGGYFYVAEGGVLEGGRLLKIDADGRISVLVKDLPTQGDYQMYGPALGPDGYVYYGVGTMTNSGVVGDDDRRGWAERFPDKHDIPCRDVTLSGENFGQDGQATGAFMPYGKPAQAGLVVSGALPCNGAVFRVAPEGGQPQLVAWGFRAPEGLAFSADGRLYVADAGYEERGSRPVWGASDVLWSVSSGTWYGWPDYSGGMPLTDRRFRSGRASPRAVLSREPGAPPKPAVWLGCRAASAGLDFSKSEQFGHIGDAFIAQFGDLAPLSGKLAGPVGFKVVRVDFDEGYVEDFAVNKGARNGPASLAGSGGLERPIAARFDPTGAALYVVDFGVVTAERGALRPRKGTGALWRIVRRG